FAHAVRASARLRFLARIPQSGEADARRRRGARAKERSDEPAAARGRSQTHRSIARGIPGDIRAGLRPLALADVARRRAGRVVHHRLSRPAGAATALPAARRIDERRRIAHAMAIPARADGAADDRRENRHRRLRRPRLSARHRCKAPHLLRSVPAVDLPHSALAAAQAAARARGRHGVPVRGKAGRVMTLDLRGHFTEFRAAQPGRIHLAAHSHHSWPDAACDAHRRALADAARLADNKWEAIFGELIPRAQRGVAAILGLPDPATIAFAPNTHDFVRRLISALPPGATPRLLTTASAAHSLPPPGPADAGLAAVDRIPAEPFASFPERFAPAARRGGHDLVFVSQIFFNSAGACGSLDAIAGAVRDPQTLVVFDGYHGFMALPTAL